MRECVLAGRKRELSSHFFLSGREGGGWTYTGVRQVCRHLSAHLGFPVSSYMFRRLVATQMFATRVPMQDIQHHLGHTEASTTFRYIQGHQSMTMAGMGVMDGLMAATCARNDWQPLVS